MRLLITAGVAWANCLLYGLGFLVAARLSFAEHPALMCVAFLLASVVVGLWSRWWAVIFPAGFGFLWGTSALKWAIHFTDTRGGYAPPMSQYIFNPSQSEAVWSMVAGAAAGIGWWISTLWYRRAGALLHGSAR